MSDEQLITKSYEELQKDPRNILYLIDKFVEIQIVKNISYAGFVHSIDPVSHSIILSQPFQETYKTILIPGHAIMKVSEQAFNADIKQPPRKIVTEKVISESDILRKKRRVVEWFKSNMLPVKELGTKIVLGNVSILPPYGLSDICAENPMVAMHVKKILARLPPDFSEDLVL